MKKYFLIAGGVFIVFMAYGYLNSPDRHTERSLYECEYLASVAQEKTYRDELIGLRWSRYGRADNSTDIYVIISKDIDKQLDRFFYNNRGVSTKDAAKMLLESHCKVKE